MARLSAWIVLFVLSTSARAEDWPSWRGPRGDGSSLEKNLPLVWSDKDNIVWKAPLPGIGHSSPAVASGRIYVTTCLLKEKDRVLLCLDQKSGAVLWQRVVLNSPLEPKHKLNSYASSTPACDGERVFVSFLRSRRRSPNDRVPDFTDTSWEKQDYWGEMVVVCYSKDGDKLWETVTGPFFARHGFSSAPILYKNLVILNGDQDADGFLVALDKTSGNEVWRTPRPHRTRSYCAPLIVQAAGKTQMVLSGTQCVASYNPDNGKLHWMIDGPTEQFVASLVYTDNVFFLTAGYPTYHNMGIRPDGQGNVTKTHVLWHENKTTSRNASYVPSPIAFEKWFYLIADVGYLSCFEARTGKRLFIEQLGRHHSASPVLADGHLYLTDDDGITYVLKAGPKLNLVARNELSEECYASPAVSDSRIYLRTLHHLWCIGNSHRP
ncbi:MAG: PQQ-binding-like beta-propeller repeat protein [Gemmataceae bacterium]|nr:PQQ-binding-like beta-propeller repeat protein [Gemmataceae bacterium]MCI0741397.1 PQQ-binding-like beta-propeller repeat protein [Gemmataceae bacterium]